MHRHGCFFNCVTLTLIFAESFDSFVLWIEARGPKDFGWDPVFEPSESAGQTFAEMNKEGGDPQHGWAREPCPKKSSKQLEIPKLSSMNSIRKSPDILDEVLSVDGFCWFGRGKNKSVDYNHTGHPEWVKFENLISTRLIFEKHLLPTGGQKCDFPSWSGTSTAAELAGE